MNILVGAIAPPFTLPASDGTQWSLEACRGQKVVIFFYPKNMTPACSQEACDLRDRYAELREHNAVVVGISMDTIKSHLNFTSKKELPYLLLSDEDHKICELYDVWQLKKLYGREYMGIVRTTFLIDEQGIISHIWPKVKVKGHADAVLEAVRGN